MASSTQHAPRDHEELKRSLTHDTKVKVAGIDIDGVLRGKYMSKDKFLSAVSSGGFGFCSVIFGWDIHDTPYTKELSISNRANGFRDVIATIDLSTFRRIPWEGNVPFFLVSFLDPDTKEPIIVDPRGILKIIANRAAAVGYECFAGVEYEYFNFKETPQGLADKGFHNLQPLTPGMHGYSLLRPQLNNQYFQEIFDKSLEFEIPVEGHHTETGPGVLETALAYTSALRMADNAILFKFLAKSIGMKNGVLPSFMAKPWENLPGCSGHVHVSLKDAANKNIFSISDSEIQNGGRTDAAYDDTKFISQEAEWFLAGILDGIADVMPMVTYKARSTNLSHVAYLQFVPTINGYRRLLGGEAFWAPNSITFGYDSRVASIRIISPPSVLPTATRFEVRVPGADMNPYFALSAIFGLGIRGIDKKLPLLEPPITQMAPGDNKVKKLATSLEAATERMMLPESVAREVFGNVFVDHYGGTREHEVDRWNRAVTDWEIARYLELA